MRIVPPLTDAERAQFIASARLLLTAAGGKPVPFRHQGRTLRGLDCIGTLVFALRGVGRAVADRVDYGRMPAQRKLAESLEAHFGPPVREAMRPGDIVTMAWGSDPGHVAIVVDHERGLGLIHSYAENRCVIEQGLDDQRASRITSIYRP